MRGVINPRVSQRGYCFATWVDNEYNVSHERLLEGGGDGGMNGRHNPALERYKWPHSKLKRAIRKKPHSCRHRIGSARWRWRHDRNSVCPLQDCCASLPGCWRIVPIRSGHWFRREKISMCKGVIYSSGEWGGRVGWRDECGRGRGRKRRREWLMGW